MASRKSRVDWGRCLEEQESLVLKNNNNNVNDVNEDKPEELNLAEASLLQKIIRKGLVENDCDLEVERRDPNSPLHYVNTFQNLPLPPNLLKSIYEMGFNAPSKIQETALPCLLATPPQNLIAQSQSGTGKTAAFVLAMLTKVDASLDYPQVLCLSPTYELAVQTGEVAARMSQYCPEIRLKYAVRGEIIPKGMTIKDHIIIGTPGKVVDWSLKQRAFDLDLISVFVLDEADVMIATQGHKEQCIRIHHRLNRKCQMMFFSATYGEEIMKFAEIIVPRPLIIRLRREEQCLKNIKQLYMKCPNTEAKYKAVTILYSLLKIGQCIIFCDTRKQAHWLAGRLNEDGHSVAVLTGELSVQDRLAVLDHFRETRERILISTNVLSRGIDIERVTIVINFDLPVTLEGLPDYETYLHRIGRSGRFGKSGIAISFVDSPESLAICNAIEKYFQVKIKYLDADDSDEIEKLQH